MKRYTLLLLLVLGVSTPAWGHHIGMTYVESNLTIIHWSSWGLCPTPCPSPTPCPMPTPCSTPCSAAKWKPKVCQNSCQPHWPCGPSTWGVTSSNSESYTSTTGPGTTAIAETSSQAHAPGSYSSSHSYSESINP